MGQAGRQIDLVRQPVSAHKELHVLHPAFWTGASWPREIVADQYVPEGNWCDLPRLVVSQVASRWQTPE